MVIDLIKTFSFALLCSFYSIYAQDIPPVAKYTADVYEADNQNWSVTQTEDKTMFFANGKGLLKYDGERWKLLGSPNKTILRSVYAIGNDVYTGAYMEFGVWTKDKVGVYQYHSLSDKLKLIEDEQFWNITSFDNYVVFQSLDAIYIYNLSKKSFETISPGYEITKMIVKNNVLYYHIKNQGLFKQVNGERVAVNTTSFFKRIILIDLYSIENQLFVQTQDEGIINIGDNSLYKLDNDSSILSKISVYSSLQKDNGDIYLGTISQGLIKLSQNRISFNLNQENAISNNTVLSLYEDRDNKVWLGLDNGINCVNIDSSVSIFNDQNGKLGTIYTSIKFNSKLYLGTNQGLFYYDGNTYEMINGTRGQVWSLFAFNNTLFCGHHNGSFKITSDNKAELLGDSPGTWIFKVYDDNTIFTGNYEGLNVLKYQDNQWNYDRKINGLDISTKYFEFIDPKNIIINHEYKGVFKVRLNETLTEVESIVKDSSVDKGLFSSIVKLKNKILYAYREGVYYYDYKSASFKKDSTLSKLYKPSNYNSGRLVKTDDNKIWLFSKTDINQISMSSVKGGYNIRKIPIDLDARQQISGYENVSLLGSNSYLIGKSNGYLKVNTTNISNVTSKILLKTVKVNNKNDESIFKNIEKTKDNLVKNRFNNISFELTALNYNQLLKSEYQYKLEGYNNKWSKWSTSGQVSFKNLDFGDYVFSARSRIGAENVSEPLTYSFSIGRPFYFSNLMIIVYVLILITLLIIVHNLYKQNYKRKNIKLQLDAQRKLELKELESQREIMEVKNDKLKLDVENKNRELAIATMTLVKKNEFLSKIKSDLKPEQSKNKVIKKVLKTINSNLNNTDDWKFFEEAFNNADKDFFKKLKESHPKLTPNELKLCAYLRLNLTSKEIAPLFNISTKSVEIKRYRLRKKMKLSRNQSLTTYILSL